MHANQIPSVRVTCMMTWHTMQLGQCARVQLNAGSSLRFTAWEACLVGIVSRLSLLEARLFTGVLPLVDTGQVQF